MNVVDSSGWLEYLGQGENASAFEEPLHQVRQLLVPTIVVTEVRRRLLQQGADRHLVDQAIGGMRQARIVPLDFDLAVPQRSGQHSSCRSPTASSSRPRGVSGLCCGRKTPTSKVSTVSGTSLRQLRKKIELAGG